MKINLDRTLTPAEEAFLANLSDNIAAKLDIIIENSPLKHQDSQAHKLKIIAAIYEYMSGEHNHQNAKALADLFGRDDTDRFLLATLNDPYRMLKALMAFDPMTIMLTHKDQPPAPEKAPFPILSLTFFFGFSLVGIFTAIKWLITLF